MVKIRLTQTGSKNRKTYRIIAIDESKRRDGEALEIIGHYNPLVKPAEITVNQERLDYWTAHGAQVTDAVKKIIPK